MQERATGLDDGEVTRNPVAPRSQEPVRGTTGPETGAVAPSDFHRVRLIFPPTRHSVRNLNERVPIESTGREGIPWSNRVSCPCGTPFKSLTVGNMTWSSCDGTLVDRETQWAASRNIYIGRDDRTMTCAGLIGGFVEQEDDIMSSADLDDNSDEQDDHIVRWAGLNNSYVKRDGHMRTSATLSNSYVERGGIMASSTDMCDSCAQRNNTNLNCRQGYPLYTEAASLQAFHEPLQHLPRPSSSLIVHGPTALSTTSTRLGRPAGFQRVIEQAPHRGWYQEPQWNVPTNTVTCDRPYNNYSVHSHTCHSRRNLGIRNATFPANNSLYSQATVQPFSIFSGRQVGKRDLSVQASMRYRGS